MDGSGCRKGARKDSRRDKLKMSSRKGELVKTRDEKEEIVTEEKKPKPWPRDATSQSGNYSFLCFRAFTAVSRCLIVLSTTHTIRRHNTRKLLSRLLSVSLYQKVSSWP